MIIKLKDLEDLEGTHYFSFPLIIMRKKMDKEQFLTRKNKNIQLLIFTLIGTFLFFALMAVLLKMVFFIFIPILMGLFIFLIILYSRHRIQYVLKTLENLPDILPFIIFDKENIKIYDTNGILIKSFETKSIKDFRYWSRSYGNGYSENGFEIVFNGKLFERFIYNITRQECFTDIFYIERDNNQYNSGNYIWLISNMLDMLKQNPNAEHFPFRRKNYINDRKWDEP